VISFHGTQILVQPVECFLNDVIPVGQVTGVKESVTFVFGWRCQQPEQGKLAGIQGVSKSYFPLTIKIGIFTQGTKLKGSISGGILVAVNIATGFEINIAITLNDQRSKREMA
jgi:hypothetical protein